MLILFPSILSQILDKARQSHHISIQTPAEIQIPKAGRRAHVHCTCTSGTGLTVLFFFPLLAVNSSPFFPDTYFSLNLI